MGSRKSKPSVYDGMTPQQIKQLDAIMDVYNRQQASTSTLPAVSYPTCVPVDESYTISHLSKEDIALVLDKIGKYPELISIVNTDGEAYFEYNSGTIGLSHQHVLTNIPRMTEDESLFRSNVYILYRRLHTKYGIQMTNIEDGTTFGYGSPKYVITFTGCLGNEIKIEIQSKGFIFNSRAPTACGTNIFHFLSMERMEKFIVDVYNNTMHDF